MKCYIESLERGLIWIPDVMHAYLRDVEHCRTNQRHMDLQARVINIRVRIIEF